MFDFKKTYINRTNDELVQIVANPSGYQPEAVAAARRLLEDRNITEEELQGMISPPETATDTGAGMVRYEAGETDIFNEILRRTLPETVQLKRRIISIWLGVNAAYVITVRLCFKIKYYYPGARIVYSMEFLTLLTMAFPFTIIYLLYRQDKRGRLLGIANSFYCLLHLGRSIYYVVRDDGIYTTAFDIGWFIYILAMHVTTLTLLFQPDFRLALPVSSKTIVKGMLAALFVFLFDLYMNLVVTGYV